MITAGEARKLSMEAREVPKPNELDRLTEIENAIKLAIHKYRGKMNCTTIDFIVSDNDYKTLTDNGYEVIRGYMQEDTSQRFTTISW